MSILQTNDQQIIRLLPVADIVAHALETPVVSIGQLSPEQKKELEKAVRDGILKKGQGGGFAKTKTVYANPSYDIEGEHQKEIDKMVGSTGSAWRFKERGLDQELNHVDDLILQARDTLVGMVSAYATTKPEITSQLKRASDMLNKVWMDLGQL
jgi:hypothetical protein